MYYLDWRKGQGRFAHLGPMANPPAELDPPIKASKKRKLGPAPKNPDSRFTKMEMDKIMSEAVKKQKEEMLTSHAVAV